MRWLPYPWRVLLITVFGMVPAFQDQSISQIVVNQIRGPFGTTTSEAQFITTAFFIGVFCTNVGASYLCLRFGPRRVYLDGLAVFMVASILCPLAGDIWTLIAGRLLMALAAGLITPAALVLVFASIVIESSASGGPATPSARPVLLISVLSAALFSTQVSPAVGVYLSQIGDWRWEYWVNLPVTALALLLGLIGLRELPTNPRLRADPIGWLLAIVFVVSLLSTTALASDDTYHWRLGPTSHWLLVASALALIGFLWWELHVEQPLVELRLLRRARFARAALVAGLAFLLVVSTQVLIVRYLQNPIVRNLGNLAIAHVIVIKATGSLVGIVLMGVLLPRFGLRVLAIVGVLIVAATTWELRFLDVITPDETLLRIVVVQGIGLGMILAGALFAFRLTLPPNEIDQAASIQQLVQRLALGLGTPLMSTLLTYRGDWHTALISGTLRSELPVTAELLRTQGPAALTTLVNSMAAIQSLDDAYLVLTIVSVAAAVILLPRIRSL